MLSQKTSCLFFLLIFLCSCGFTYKRSDNPPGYDLNSPRQVKLPLQLDEISGLSYYAKDSSIFAIIDEAGVLYKIHPDQHIDSWKFAAGADYEDVVELDSTFYILVSKGKIVKVNFQNNEAIAKEFAFPFGKGNEFETLYYDSTAKKLFIICKDCETDKKKSLTTYSFDPATDTFSDTSFTINVTEIDKILGIEKTKFKPSAAAINPADGLLYIISSINKLLVVAEPTGKVKGCYRLSPSLFKQPEGITFKPDGTMIISNEFAGTGAADLLIFKYNKPKS